MFIEDGRGSGRKAEVDDHHRLSVACVTENEIAHQSRVHGLAYTWTHSYNYAAADTILALRNDSTTQNLIIDRIIIASDTTTAVTVHSPSGTTFTGTAVTGVNLNRQSGNVALATAKGDETGNTQANVIFENIILANAPIIMPVEGAIILGYLDELAVDFVTVGTLGAVTFRGFYKDRE